MATTNAARPQCTAARGASLRTSSAVTLHQPDLLAEDLVSCVNPIWHTAGEIAVFNHQILLFKKG